MGVEETLEIKNGLIAIFVFHHGIRKDQFILSNFRELKKLES